MADKISAEEIKKLNEQIKALKGLSEAKDDTTKKNIELARSEAILAERYGDVLTALDANRSVSEKYKALVASISEATEKTTELQAERIKQLRDEAEELKKAAIAANEYIKKIEDLGPGYEKTLRKAGPVFKDLSVKMGLMSKGAEDLSTNIAEIASGVLEKGGFRGLGKVLFEAFNPLTMGLSLMTKIAEATIKNAFAVDAAGASYAKSTGMGREFDSQINKIALSQRKFGIEAEQAEKAFQSLRTGLSQFNALSSATQINLAKTVSGLESIGVSGDDSVSVINSLNKGFGLSASSAARLTKEIALSGKALGMTASKITKEYKESLKILGVYGKDSVKIFTNIAAMAQSAGVQISTLTDLATKFDTFSDATKTAAKMNAILGTSFSGNNLMMMKHDEKIEHMIRGIKGTGIEFRKLNRFAKQAVGDVLGITDMDELIKTLSMSTTEFSRLRASQEKQRKSDKEFEERMAATVDVMKRLKLLMAEFAVSFEPLVPGILKFATAISKAIKFLTELHPVVLVVTGAALFFIKTFLKMKSIGIAIGGAGKAAATTGPAIAKLGTSMGVLAKSATPLLFSFAAVLGAAAALAKTMFDGIVLFKVYRVGWEDVAKGLTVFAGSVGVLSAALVILDKVVTKLARNPLGMAVAGIVAGIAGVTAGLALSNNIKSPEVNTKSILDSTKDIDSLAGKLEKLATQKENIKDTFAAIGEGLEISKKSLDAKIESTLANIALITTGQASGDMNTATMKTFNSVNKLVSVIGKHLGADSDDGPVLLQISGDELTKFVDGRIAAAYKK